jgi:hypothetical protein
VNPEAGIGDSRIGITDRAHHNGDARVSKGVGHDPAFRNRARRIQQIDSADRIVVEADQTALRIGLISNAGAAVRGT